MLHWFNQRKDTIAGSALGAFIAGWLLFFCQACLAQPLAGPQMTVAPGSIETGMPCHEEANETHTPVPADHDAAEHCLGACDCDAVAASLNSVEQPWTADKPSSLNPEPAAISVVDIGKSIQRKLTASAERPPDRALLLPFQRYNVLLI